MLNKWTIPLEIAGENYVLDIEAARTAGVLVLEDRFHDGQYFKYNSNVFILIKDQRLNFNLYNLTCNCWLSNRWYISDKMYLTYDDLFKFIGMEEYHKFTPLKNVKFETK